MKISVVYITNGKRNDILEKCLQSALLFADEVIVVGNVEGIKNDKVKKINKKELSNKGYISNLRNIGSLESIGDIVINADDDIWFPPMFKKKLLKYIKLKPNFESFTTKVIGINGGRYWDRVVNLNESSFMIDYNDYHPNLYYSGAFLIRTRDFSKKFMWNEDSKYSFVGKIRKSENSEDVEFSNRIKKNNYIINIDTDNYVVHLDRSYITYRNGDGFLVCEKNHLVSFENIITEKKEFRELEKMINFYEL